MGLQDLGDVGLVGADVMVPHAGVDAQWSPHLGQPVAAQGSIIFAARIIARATLPRMER